MIAAAGAYVREHVNGLSDAASWDLDDVEPVLAMLRGRGVPAEGRPFDEILADVALAVPKSLNTAGPGYLAYIPGGGLFAAALADFVAAAVNRYTGMWSPSPALVKIENDVVRWLAELFEYPASARGVLTSGGSLSNLSAIVTARHAILGEDFAEGTLYVSSETHHSVSKAAVIAGIARRHVRVVPTTAALRMDARALDELVTADRAAGLAPFCVVASAGTTNTGAIDPLDEIASIAERHRMWLHADGAYGGFFQLTERGHARFSGISRADSITLDPHKGMFLPYGTGALLVREGAHLRAAHSASSSAGYLQDLRDEGELPNFSDYSPELSRDFRGLRVWLPLQLHGVDAFRAALDEKLDLARYVYDELRAIGPLEMRWEPELSTVAFRARDEATSRALLDRINASKRVFLSSTIAGGRFTLRVSILSHRSHRDRVEEAVAIIRDAANDLA